MPLKRRLLADHLKESIDVLEQKVSEVYYHISNLTISSFRPIRSRGCTICYITGIIPIPYPPFKMEQSENVIDEQQLHNTFKRVA